MRNLGAMTVAALVAGAWGAAAAPMAEGGLHRGPGSPISQVMRGEGMSLVRTPEAVACVLSRPIDIRASRYADGDMAAPFASVRRSPAASWQAVSVAGRESFRIQFKYPLDPSRPPAITLGGAERSLAGFVEPSGDSVRIDDATLVAALREALSGGGEVLATGWSADTGRRIVDRLPPAGFAGLDDCSAAVGAGLRGAAPSRGLMLRFAAAPDLATRADDGRARECGASDIGLPLHRGRVLETRGFFAQTDEVLVAFDREGRAVQAWVPGVFEALRGRGDAVAADVSIAADANAPAETNRVRGCLGSAATALCAAPSTRAGEFAFGPCGAEEALVSPVAAQDGAWSGAGGPASFGGAFDGGGGGGSDPSSPVLARQPSAGGPDALPYTPPIYRAFTRGGPPPEPQPPVGPPPSVPAPPALLLLLSAAAWLVGLGRRRARR